LSIIVRLSSFVVGSGTYPESSDTNRGDVITHRVRMRLQHDGEVTDIDRAAACAQGRAAVTGFDDRAAGYWRPMTNHDDFTAPEADREPTPEETSAADRALPDVDLESVAKEFEHMNELGAEVHGEGQIEPDKT
jgi:hypothetical protein